MMILLDNTSAREINEALYSDQKQGMSSAGKVLTLIVNTDPEGYETAARQARKAGRLHPSRVLVAVRGHHDDDSLTALIDESLSTTELITLKFGGDVDRHAATVLLPLLLPELPVVLWHPRFNVDSPSCSLDPLTQRVIVDSTTAADPITTLQFFAAHHRPQRTDLAWTRLTRWRGMLVAAVDQVRAQVISGTIGAEANNSPAVLMKAWLEMQTGAPFTIEHPQTTDPHRSYSTSILGLHYVTLKTTAGEIALRRRSTAEAVLSLPDQPDRFVALSRQTIQDQLGEELMRLNGDDTLDRVMEYLSKNG